MKAMAEQGAIKFDCEVINTPVDFKKTSLDYNWGFIDGIMWFAENRNKVGIEDMLSMVENILKVNDDIINEDAKRFERLKQNLKIE